MYVSIHLKVFFKTKHYERLYCNDATVQIANWFEYDYNRWIYVGKWYEIVKCLKKKYKNNLADTECKRRRNACVAFYLYMLNYIV